MVHPDAAWLTAAEAAERLSLSLAAVYEEITAGRLPAQRYADSYLVRRSDCEAFRHPVAAAG